VLELQSPFTYMDTLLKGATIAAEGQTTAYAGPQLIQVAGGSIPIATARGLAGNIVIIEGIATMYTGFFAGSSGIKFYIEDESGGVQVYVPGGMEAVHIRIGDFIRGLTPFQRIHSSPSLAQVVCRFEPFKAVVIARPTYAAMPQQKALSLALSLNSAAFGCKTWCPTMMRAHPMACLFSSSSSRFQ
jgi:hypothetical protein